MVQNSVIDPPLPCPFHFSSTSARYLPLSSFLHLGKGGLFIRSLSLRFNFSDLEIPSQWEIRCWNVRVRKTSHYIRRPSNLFSCQSSLVLGWPKTLFSFFHKIKDIFFCPGWCGSVDCMPACKPKGCWFDSQSGHMPGLWDRLPNSGCVRGNHTFMFLTLFFSFPSPLSKNKLIK